MVAAVDPPGQAGVDPAADQLAAEAPAVGQIVESAAVQLVAVGRSTVVVAAADQVQVVPVLVVDLVADHQQR